MDYDAIAAIFLTPREPAPPEPPVPATPARRLRDSLEAIATQGWWPRPVFDRMTALGLDFFGGYVWGRAASLGEPPPSVVAATFGVFEPGFLAVVYDNARAGATREQVLAARADGAIASLETVLADDADQAAELADVLLASMASLDATARPLFAALRALPVPTSPHGRLWRGAELVREHRGDGHLAACVCAGLDTVTMNVLTELWLGYAVGEYSSTRGYGPDAQHVAVAGLSERGWVADGALTDPGTVARNAIEASTDRSQDALVHALGDRLDDVVARATALSAKVITAGAAPADPRKRAAG
jgi:hypothetical protein